MDDGILGVLREGGEGFMGGRHVMGPEASVTRAEAAWRTAVREACERVALAWPLDGRVVVNPYFGFCRQDFEKADLTLMRVAGSAFTMPRRYYREQIAAGRITRGDVAEALKAYGLPSDEGYAARLLAHEDAPPPQGVPLVSRVMQKIDPDTPWAAFCAGRVSRFLAAYLDADQASWPLPWRSQPLYDAWRGFARLDASPRAAGLGVADIVSELPRRPLETIERVLRALAIPDAHIADYCHAALLDIGGWATCARHSRPRHGCGKIEDLLAIRLAWELILFRAGRVQRLRAAWRTELAALPQTPAVHSTADAGIDHVLQAALEFGYRRRIVADLGACVERPIVRAGHGRDALQAVFCMSTCSEVFRRALEEVVQGIRTIGFSGFCGFPPTLAHCEPFMEAVINTALLADDYGQSVDGKAVPIMAGADESAVAGAILRVMSLTDGFSRLVLLVTHGPLPGHESHGASASRGPTWTPIGELDARTVATLLNDPAIRARLVQEGIAIPADTCFVAAWYDSARDEVTLFDAARWEATHAQDMQDARAALEEAGRWARKERGRTSVFAAQGAGVGRAQEWGRVFTEQESIGNAAFIAAPRSRTEGMVLDGRAFLHDYEWHEDKDFRILRFIMTVPMMAAHWMNLHYYTSVIDNARFGGGNKIRQEMFGGPVGILEGAGGDPRDCLPVLSLFGGRHRVQEPMRLNAFVEAPRAQMDEVLEHHEIVRNVVDHGWLFLFQMDSEAGGIFLRDRDGRWRQVS